MEEGVITAVQLVDVICEDLAIGSEVYNVEPGTQIRIRKSPKQIAPPATTEELRNRLRTLAITYVLAGYKHSSRLWLRTCSLSAWLEHCEFLLSDQCAGYALDTEGISVRASWATVLHYDYQLRKVMTRSIVYDGNDFLTAMRLAIADLQCRERYFITPTAMLQASSKHRAPTQPLPPGAPAPFIEALGAVVLSNTKKKKQAKLAKKTALTKGGAGTDVKPKIFKTPDGRFICSFYQTEKGCAKATCKFVHVCQECNGKHPLYMCKKVIE